MKTQQTLLITYDTIGTDVVKIQADEKNLAKKMKVFLQKLPQLSRQKVKSYSPVTITVRAEDKDGSATAYEAGKFVIVLPEGKKHSARLYGNWDEALIFVKSIFK